MKRFAAIFLALLLVISLAACAAKGDTKNFTFEITTDAETLAQALTKEGLISESAQSPGLYDTIDGEYADWSDNESWWCISKDGESLSAGMQETPVEDGAHYEAVFTHGFAS